MSRLTIFEGPDGSGKTTAAKTYAGHCDARYVHLGTLSGVTENALGRIYLESMLPALLGYQDVVLDRSWMSEWVYGASMRDGNVRLNDVDGRMLDRLAWRCETLVVFCEPPLKKTEQVFRTTKQYVDNLSTHRAIYRTYRDERLTSLPNITWDYTQHPDDPFLTFMSEVRILRSEPHPTNVQSVGNLEAPFLVVGESFAKHNDFGSFYRYPFVSFKPGSSAYWLTEQLDKYQAAGHHNFDEANFLWINADDHVEELIDR